MEPIHDYFEHWGEFLTFVNRKPPSNGSNASHYTSYQGGFEGTRTFQEAIDLATKGWDEGTKLVDKLSSPLVDKVASKIVRFDPVYDVEGGAIDMGRYIEGIPESCLRFEETTINGPGRKLFKIVMDCTVSAGVSKQVMQARGAAMVALVQCLEMSGIRCRVEVLPYCTSNHGYGKEDHKKIAYSVRVCVKDYEQGLDLPRLVYAMAHPSVLRRLGFVSVSQHGKDFDNFISSGSVVTNPEPGFDRGDLFLGGGHVDNVEWANPESAKEWIIKNLKEQGITLKA
jgi:hypothetical protein